MRVSVAAMLVGGGVAAAAAAAMSTTDGTACCCVGLWRAGAQRVKVKAETGIHIRERLLLSDLYLGLRGRRFGGQIRRA